MSKRSKKPETAKDIKPNTTFSSGADEDGDLSARVQSDSTPPSSASSGNNKINMKKEYLRCNDCKLYSCEALDLVANPLEKASLIGRDSVLVDLKGRGLRGVDCIALGKILASDCPIGHLNLSDCLLIPQGFQALMDGLCKNVKLHTLELRGNNIQGEMIVHLSKCIKLNKHLKNLHLEWNCVGICLQHFDLFAESIGVNSGLEYLDLRNNQITAESAGALNAILTRNKNLKEIDLRWNTIGLVGAKGIWDALRHNFTLSKIHLCGNFIPEDVVSYIEECLSKHHERETLVEDYEKRTTVLTRQLQFTENEYKQEIQMLIKNFRAEEEELNNILKEQESKIEYLESKLKDETLISHGQVLEIDKLKAKLICSSDKEETLKKTIEIKEEHIEQLEKMYKSELDTIKNSCEFKLRTAQCDQVEKSKELTHYDNKINKLEEEIEQKSNEINNLKEQIETMRKSAEENRIKFEERVKFEKEKWTNWKNEVETTEKREISQLESEIKEMQASLMDHIKLLERGKADAEEEVRIMKLSLRTAKSEAEEEMTQLRIKMKNEQDKIVDSHFAQIAILKEQNEKLEAEVQRISCLMRKFESENGTLLRQNENVRQQMSHLEQELMSKETTLHLSLNRTRADLKEQMEQLIKEEEANKTLRCQVLELQEQLATLTMKQNREIQEKFSEMDHWKTQVERREGELNRLKEEDMRRAGLLHEAFLAYMRSTSAATGLPLPQSYYNPNFTNKIETFSNFPPHGDGESGIFPSPIQNLGEGDVTSAQEVGKID